MNAKAATFALIASAVFLTFLGAEFVRSQENCTPTESVTTFGDAIDPAEYLDVGNPTSAPAAGLSLADGARMKVLFELVKDESRYWRVTIYDRANHVLANFSSDDFHSAAGQQWTGLLPADSRAELVAPPDSNIKIALADVVTYPGSTSGTKYFSIQQNTPQWRSLYDQRQDEIAQKVGASVGMVVGSGQDGAGRQVEWCCTGVMVAKDVMLTNWHCGGAPGVTAWNPDICPKMLIDLSWDDRPMARQQYSCAQVLVADEANDYALIRLTPVVGGSMNVGEPIYSSLSEAVAVSNSNVFAVHHAQCKPKLLSSPCQAASGSPANGAGPGEFVHTCDTEPGSSGAPIFDVAGRLMGLHHRGFLRDAGCNVIGPKWNYAISIRQIVQDLKSNHPAVAHSLGL